MSNLTYYTDTAFYFSHKYAALAFPCKITIKVDPEISDAFYLLQLLAINK